MSVCIHLRHGAYEGDPVSWSGRVFPARPLVETPRAYNTRRLDEMVAHAVNAALRAMAEAGIPQSEHEGHGVISISHNGPCAYSEGFYRQVIEEENPQLVSPMLFTESVLNIVASHVALALQTRRPALAFNADLPGFFGLFHQIGALIECGHMERAVLCCSEEFPAICRELFAACPDLPGHDFRGGAAALILSAQPIGDDSVRLHVPSDRPLSPVEGFARARRRADDGWRIVRSAFSGAPASEWPTDIAFEESFAAGAVMEREQGFTILRAAEVADAARMVRETGPALLAQADRDGVGLLELDSAS